MNWIDLFSFFLTKSLLSVTYLKRQQVQQNCTFRRFIALQAKYVVPRDLRKHLLWQKPLLETSYNNPFILCIVILLWHFEEIFHFEETFPEKFILYSCCTLCLSWLMKVKIFTIFWVRKIRKNKWHIQTTRVWGTRYSHYWNVHREKSIPSFSLCHQLSEMVWHSNIYTHLH